MNIREAPVFVSLIIIGTLLGFVVGILFGILSLNNNYPSRNAAALKAIYWNGN